MKTKIQEHLNEQKIKVNSEFDPPHRKSELYCVSMDPVAQCSEVKMDLKRRLGFGAGANQNYELIRSTQSLVDRYNIF